jgi:cellulose synthase/poly-beta-1,6-N-acetylglucosamine synthase-like glycosyltransferase
MTDLEIPMGKRTRKYRFFEMVPALVSYGAIILLFVLSILDPLLAAAYMLIIMTTVLTKAASIAYHMVQGRRLLTQAQKVNWHTRLEELNVPSKEYIKKYSSSSHFDKLHASNLTKLLENPTEYPKPSELYNAVIIATYNEPYEVLRDTIQTVVETTYDNDHIILLLAYEARGGEQTKETAKRLVKEFGKKFYHFEAVEHPDGLENEVVGKGGNITYAGRHLKTVLTDKAIAAENVIVTTLDSDNRPYASYFDYVTYEYIVHPNRKRLSYQPISLFLNNIWDVPAPMRVVATGNSFWNIISAMRPHTLRNFASHSQPMDALIEMDFWSTRTIVEDGHQYWRSYFHFDGDYDVLPIFVPIYQDAVMSSTYTKTLRAQFVQLRRWAYGASDVPYVATRVFTKKRTVSLFGGASRFIRLLDGHVTLACIPLLVTFGGWVPLFFNSEAARSVAANQLPEVLGIIQRIAMVGLIITIFLSFKMLPPRPARYKRRRNLGMLLQWVLMPVTALAYSSTSAYYSQTRLLLGKYLDVFDVTEKATVVSVQNAKKRRRAFRKFTFGNFLKKK